MNPDSRRSVFGSPLTSLVYLLAAVSFLSGCSSLIPKFGGGRPPLRTVAFVDLPRFMGDWRVIAHIPHRADKGWVDSIQSYALRPDGRIETWTTFRRKSFDAPQKTVRATIDVVNSATNAEWSVEFFGLTRNRYFITDLDPAYQWAVIGHPSRKYGWIIARDRLLPEGTFEAILDRLAVRGYDPAKFVQVPQFAGGDL